MAGRGQADTSKVGTMGSPKNANRGPAWGHAGGTGLDMAKRRTCYLCCSQTNLKPVARVCARLAMGSGTYSHYHLDEFVKWANMRYSNNKNYDQLWLLQFIRDNIWRGNG